MIAVETCGGEDSQCSSAPFPSSEAGFTVYWAPSATGFARFVSLDGDRVLWLHDAGCRAVGFDLVTLAWYVPVRAGVAAEDDLIASGNAQPIGGTTSTNFTQALTMPPPPQNPACTRGQAG